MEDKNKDENININKINQLIKRLERQVANNTSLDDENNKIRGVYHIDYDKNKNINILNENYKVLVDNGYTVEILNNIECKNAADSNKYIIKISNSSGVYYDINLLWYKSRLTEKEFDQYKYIADILTHIEGTASYNEDIIYSIIKILAIIMSDRKYFTITYSVLGFDRLIINNKVSWVFKYDKIYDGDYNELSGRLLEYDTNIVIRNSSHKANEMQWLACISNVMNSHVLDAMLLGAGVSGLIRQILPFSKDSNININICGEPGTGKSTIGHLILSIYGNPQFLEGNFSDTENAIEQLRGSKPILPYVIDDRMLKYIGETTDQKRALSILIDIFRESEGRIKERLGSMSVDSGKRTYSAVISSSVDSITTALDRLSGAQNKDIGQYRRYIEILLDKDDERYTIASNKEEAEEIEYQAQTNYGFGIKHISSYMLDKLNNEGKKYFINQFDELNQRISQKLTDNIKASSQRFALIVLSYRILREALNNRIIEIENGIMPEDVYETNENNKIQATKIPKIEIIENNEDKIEDLLINNLAHKMVGVAASKKPSNNLKTWITDPDNLVFFLQCDKVFDCNSKTQNQTIDKKKILGNINISSDYIEIAYNSKYALESILFSPGLKEIKLKEFYTYFEPVRNIGSTTQRLEEYKKCGDAVEFFGSNVRKNSRKKEIVTPIDAFVYNEDNKVVFKYHKKTGSYYDENGEVKKGYMTYIKIIR